MFLLLSFALSAFAHSSIIEGGCRSPSLLQTSTRERGSERGGTDSAFEPNLTTWKKLFPKYSVLNLDEMSDSAVTLALDTCSKMPRSYCDGFANGNTQFNKSAVWKMINPSVYAAADGSLRTLALVSDYNKCQCADRPHNVCEPPEVDFSGLLVSCGADDGCRAVGPGLDPHAFQFNGHPMAFTNHGGNGVCQPKLLNLTSFEEFNLTLPGMGECEKNWQPFTYNGTLFFSQWLHPVHKVLSCSVESHSCEAVFNTSTEIGVEMIHGNSPYVELDSNHFAAAAHTFTPLCVGYACERNYQHTFFAIQRQPPFAVVAQTEWFQMPVAEGHAHAEWNFVQYAGGLMRQGQDVILSYGVGDCISQAVKISIEDLRRALGL